MQPNWQSHLAAFAAATILTSGAAYKVHSWRVDSLKLKWEKQEALSIEAAKTATQEVCDGNNRITKEKARALQASLDATSARYHKLLRYNPDGAGAAAATGVARRRDEASRANVPVVQVPIVDGADAGRLNDEQAAALTTLQDVVADIYKANGQADLLPDEYR